MTVIMTVMTNLMTLSHNYRGSPSLLLLPRALAALVARLPPRPPLLDDVDEFLEEVEEDHSSGCYQAQPHSSVMVIRLSVFMMICVMTMRLESVGEKVEKRVTSQSAHS